uniref:Uncharacterized protein n=1 Tax=Rhizophora mucronata TaxID=61149 RepID=A0A2P2QSH8_RHIMU
MVTYQNVAHFWREIIKINFCNLRSLRCHFKIFFVGIKGNPVH